MKVIDCFGKELKDGDDILIARYDENMLPIINCGIILEMTDKYMVYSVQEWKGDDEIITNIKVSFKDNCQFKDIYKIR